MTDLSSVFSRFEANKNASLESLRDLCSIPSVSFDGFDAAELHRSAAKTAEWLASSGFERSEVVEHAGAHPFVVAEHIASPEAPTVLLYAHHDVQPAGDPSDWTSPPFEPTLRNERLYGRGTGDDKAGIMVHAAAVDAWRAVGGAPVNLKFVVEGEEEIGSVNLESFLAAHRERLRADALIIVDTANVDTGVPSLTNSLRGMVAVEVEVRALRGPVHSGLWGGPTPDPALALAKMLAGLVDGDGRIALPGVYESVLPPTKTEEASIAALPVGASEFRSQSGMLDGAELLGGRNPYETTWRHPSINVNAIQASSRKDARNIVVDSAWAKVGMRLVPDQNPVAMREALEEHLRKACPWGLELSIKAEADVAPWHSSTDHPAFGVAAKALESGYGCAPVIMGCGGSIPVVEPLCRTMGGGPALLIGIEDPYTNAHGIDESVSLTDLWGTTRSLIELYGTLGSALRS